METAYFSLMRKPFSAAEASRVTKTCRDSFKYDVFRLRQYVDDAVYRAAHDGHYAVNIDLRKAIKLAADESDEPYWDTVISGLNDSLHEDGYDISPIRTKSYSPQDTSPDYKWTIMW